MMQNYRAFIWGDAITSETEPLPLRFERETPPMQMDLSEPYDVELLL